MNLPPFFSTHFPDAPGGFLYAFATGTTTPQTTYQDQAGLTTNAHPIVLDALGRCNLWLTPVIEYGFELRKADNSVVKTWIDVAGVTAAAAGVSSVNGEAGAVTLTAPDIGFTTGTSTTWYAGTTVAAGLDSIISHFVDVATAGLNGYVQFNGDGVSAGHVGLQYISFNSTLLLGNALRGISGAGAAAGTALHVRAGDGGGTSGAGGKLTLGGGDAPGANSLGGGTDVISGAGTGTSHGGDIAILPASGGTRRGNVQLNNPGSASTTTATGGFVMLPTCAGTPTGVPGDIPTGAVPMIVDTTGNKLWLYMGGAWKSATFA